MEFVLKLNVSPEKLIKNSERKYEVNPKTLKEDIPELIKDTFKTSESFPECFYLEQTDSQYFTTDELLKIINKSNDFRKMYDTTVKESKDENGDGAIVYSKEFRSTIKSLQDDLKEYLKNNESLNNTIKKTPEQPGIYDRAVRTGVCHLRKIEKIKKILEDEAKYPEIKKDKESTKTIFSYKAEEEKFIVNSEQLNPLEFANEIEQAINKNIDNVEDKVSINPVFKKIRIKPTKKDSLIEIIFNSPNPNPESDEYTALSSAQTLGNIATEANSSQVRLIIQVKDKVTDSIQLIINWFSERGYFKDIRSYNKSKTSEQDSLIDLDNSEFCTNNEKD